MKNLRADIEELFSDAQDWVRDDVRRAFSLKKRVRKQRAKHAPNVLKARARQARYAERHPDRLRARKLQWYHVHKAKLNARRVKPLLKIV